jgi:branched-chain amino acid transport system permease protein
MDLAAIIQGASSGAVLGAVYILVALGLAIVFSLLRIINFAHGEFYMLGAVVTYYLFGQLGLPFAVAVLVSAIGGFVMGVLVERALFRRFHEDLLGAFVLSLGLLWVVRMSVTSEFGAQPQGLPSVIEGVARVGGVSISFDRLMVLAVGAVIVALVSLFILRTEVGRAIRAVAQNRSAAALMGINPTWVTSFGFALGLALATLAGSLVGPLFSVEPNMGGELVVKAFIIVIIGGMGSLPGAVIAAILLGLFEGIAGLYVDNAQLAIIEFLVLAAFLVVRPRGLLGTAEA